VSFYFLVSKHVSQNRTKHIKINIRLVQVLEMYRRCQSLVTMGMIKILLPMNCLSIKLSIGLTVHA